MSGSPQTDPVVLAFEDLQWADSGLLDFIDYLLEWSAEFPIFILALGRPELLAARPDWTATITLEPLDDTVMGELLAGLVPGLPEELARRIVARAEGVPLYAVETVRMLLDRGLLAQDGNRYVVTGDIEELEVPETLHAIAAARLDTLSQVERSVVQDAAVFGMSFTAGGCRGARRPLRGRGPPNACRISSRNRSSVSTTTSSRPSAASSSSCRACCGTRRMGRCRGGIARAGISRPPATSRKRGVRTPPNSQRSSPRTSSMPPTPNPTPPTRRRSGRWHATRSRTPASGRSRSRSGQRHNARSSMRAELADDDRTRAMLLEKAGQAANMNTDFAAACERFEQAADLFESLGDREAASRSLVGLSHTPSTPTTVSMRRSRSAGRRSPGLADGTPEKAAALADLSSQPRVPRRPRPRRRRRPTAALMIAEPLQEWHTVIRGVQHDQLHPRQAGAHSGSDRAVPAGAVSSRSNTTSPIEALRSYNNLADIPLQHDRFAEAVAIAEPGLALAKERGNRRWEQALTVLIATAKVGMGQWDGLPELTDAGELPFTGLQQLAWLPHLARVSAARGDTDTLQRILTLAGEHAGSSNIEYAAGPVVAQAIALRALGRDTDALAAALPIATGPPEIANELRREAYVEAGLAALAVGDETAVAQLIQFVADMPPATRSPLLRAGAARFTGLLAARRGDTNTADEQLTEADPRAAGDRGAIRPRPSPARTRRTDTTPTGATTPPRRWSPKRSRSSPGSAQPPTSTEPKSSTGRLPQRHESSSPEIAVETAGTIGGGASGPCAPEPGFRLSRVGSDPHQTTRANVALVVPRTR